MHFAEVPEKIKWKTVGADGIKCFHCRENVAEYFCVFWIGDYGQVRIPLCSNCMKLEKAELVNGIFNGKREE